MRATSKIRLFAVVLLASVAFAPTAGAWETWTDCIPCHGDYRDSPYVSLGDGISWGDDLHDVHRRNMLSSDCDTCHAPSGRSPVFLDFATPGTGLVDLSCVGCHGREEDMGNDSVSMGRGAGLRQHHTNAGITSCETCHDDAVPGLYTPVGEDVLPPWFGADPTGHPDLPTDPCNLDGNEDYAGSTLGLDNDGDLAYDGADPDCFAPADIDVDPLSLDFGVVTVGNTATLTTTISNVGPSDLTVTGLTLAGSADFTLSAGSPAPPFVVGPGGSTDVSVDYTPDVAGSDAGTLDIASDDPDEPTVTVSLAGSGEDPVAGCDLAVAPLSLDFGSVEVGNVVGLTTTLSNNGTSDCTVSDLLLTGADFSFGAGAPAVPFTVAIGVPVDVPLDYTPSGVGADAGSLEVLSDDPDEPSITVSLAGIGIAPRDIDVSPLALDFGTVAIFTPASRITTISNLGDADLTVTAITLTGSTEYAFGSGTPAVPFVVTPGGSVDVPLDYTPIDEGTDVGSLDIASDDPDEPLVTVSLTGTGEAPQFQCDIDVSPLTLDLGSIEVGDKVTRYVFIDNTGDADCVVSGLTLTGDPDIRLNPAKPLVPFTVTPTGLLVGIPIDFSPTSTGPKTASLDVTSNDLDETVVTVSLAGTGIPPTPDINVAPLATDFGAVEVGFTSTRNIAVHNVGNADLTVTGLTLAGSTDFALNPSAPAVPFVVTSGSFVNVPVDYSPGELGGDAGTLDIASDDPDEPLVTASLAGTGIPPLADQDIDVSPLSLSYGDVEQGQSGTLITTIQNLGERELTVSGLTLTGSPDFSLTNFAPTPPFVVPSGGSVDVPVRYEPVEQAADAGSLEVASDDPDEPVVAVSLAGTGIAPILECDIDVTPLTLDFGTVKVSKKKTAYVFLDNTGDADCVVSSLSLTGSPDFALHPSAPATPFVIAVDDFVRGIPINYIPAESGPDTANLAVGSDDPDENPVNVSILGSGTLEADIDVTPAALGFGDVELTLSATRTATITNVGSQDLTVSGLTLAGSAEFTLGAGAPAVPFVLGPGASADVPVDFTPVDVGSETGSLDVASDDPDEPVVSVALFANGIPTLADQDIDVSPLSLAYGNVELGQSATLSMTIQNLGERDLTVTGLTVAGNADFALGFGAPSVPAVIPAGGSVDVPVSYIPSAEEPDSGSLDVSSDDPDEPVVSVALSGTGIAPILECDIDVTPLTLDFGTVKVSKKKTAYVFLDNTGDADCVVSSLSLTGSPDFELHPSTPATPFVIGVDDFVRGIPINYIPAESGPDTANLAVGSDDPDENPVNVSILGSGTLEADIDVTPAALGFGDVELTLSATRTATITNVGSQDLTVSGLTLAGSAEFTLGAGAPAVPFVLGPGASADVPVDFTPVDVGSETGSLDVASDDPDEPVVSVALFANGIPTLADQDIDVSPLSLAYGNVELGQSATLSTAIQNLGERDLTVNGLTVTGSADLSLGFGAPSVPFVVAAGGSVNVPVLYMPTAEEPDAGSLEVASDDPDEPVVSVSLSGTGIAPVLECDIDVSPLSVAFGSVEVGQSRVGYVFLDNTGDADCVVSSLNVTGNPDFALNPAAPATPFVIAVNDFVRGIPIDYSPSDAGPDTATLDVASDDPDEAVVSVALSGDGFLPGDQPDINLVPASLTFGPVTVGQTVSQNATIQNVGTLDLTVTGIGVSGSADFALGAGAPAVPFSIAAGSSVDVPVEYAPSGSGGDSGSLDVSSDDPDEPLVSTFLSGSGQTLQDIDVSPLALNFGTITEGQTASLSTTIQNLGDLDLTVTGLGLSGSPDFVLGAGAPGVPFVVTSGGSVVVPVDYVGNDVGGDTGTLDVASDDPDEASVLVSLTGTTDPHVAGPDIDVSPLSLAYGTVVVGNTATLTTTISNLGDTDLTVSALTLSGSGDFSLDAGAPAVPFVVTPGGSVGVPVDYAPSGVGPDSGSLAIASDDADEPTVNVSLSGTGAAAPAPEIDVSPLSLPFGSVTEGTTASLTTTIDNLGTADLTVSALTLSGSADFSLGAGAPTVPFVVGPGGSVGVPVDYSPSGVGPDSGSLAIASDDADEPTVNVSLSGTGAAAPAPEIDVSPLSLPFGSVTEGTTASLTTTIDNLGTADLTVSALTLSGSADFSLGAGAPTVPFVVGPGGSVGVPVDYSPSGVGPDSGSLAIASDDADEPTVNVSLSGTGAAAPAPEIDVSPLSLPFGSVTEGTTASLTTTINNLGTADLTVSALTLSGSADFSLGAGAPTVPFVVGPGGSVGVPVDYSPSGVGPDSGSLAIASDDADEPTVNVSLSGTGLAATAADIDVSPLTLAFGGVPVNTTATLTTTISNVGDADLTVTSLTITGGNQKFTLAAGAPAVPFIVPAGGSVDVPVDFTPTKVDKPRTGTLAIASDDPDEPTVDVTLTGVGI